MKKLFLLLILSFFSVKSLAGSCPDGSEPIKSVSADGTYFVYNCGGLVTGSASGASEDDIVRFEDIYGRVGDSVNF